MSSVSKIKLSEYTTPAFKKEASEIALQMTQYSSNELRDKFKLSPKLALETWLRFQNFHTEENSSLQTILAYTGVVFRNLKVQDFSTDDFLYAQEHIRIVSILYGLLRPLDMIKPYRMEYSIKLPELENENLYTFWQNKQTQLLEKTILSQDGILINLASMDIQPAFNWKQLQRSVHIITPEFKISKNGKLTTVVIYAKMARGQMSRFIIKNKITDPEELKTFEWEGFRYNPSLSTKDNWIFLQEG